MQVNLKFVVGEDTDRMERWHKTQIHTLMDNIDCGEQLLFFRVILELMKLTVNKFT